MVKELVMGAAWLVFSAGMLISTFGYRDVGGLATIGPAYWPRILLVGMILLALLSLARTLLRRQGSKPARREEANGRAHPNLFWATLGLILLYTLVLPHIGFPLATLGFLLAMLRVVGIRGKVKLPLLSAGISLLLIILFARLMSVPLPRGEGVFHTISLWFF